MYSSLINIKERTVPSIYGRKKIIVYEDGTKFLPFLHFGTVRSIKPERTLSVIHGENPKNGLIEGAIV